MIIHVNGSESSAQKLMVKVGESIRFTAPANPTTGYQWQLLQPLQLFKVSETYQPQKVAPHVVGAGGQICFEFIAQHVGSEQIQLVYIRPWEKYAQAVESWQCHVEVETP